jgi:hypothetical protein
VRGAAIQLAARAEQEIRAYPRLHAAFYGVVTRNATVRHFVGRVKNRVRGSSSAESAGPVLRDDPEVRTLREQAVAARLGLDEGGS